MSDNSDWVDISPTATATAQTPSSDWVDINPSAPATPKVSGLTGNPTIDMVASNQAVAQAQQDAQGINPYVKAANDSLDQSVGNFTKGAYDASKFIIPTALQKLLPQPFTPAPANNPISQAGANISRALGAAGSTIALSNPLIKGAMTIPAIASKSPLIASLLASSTGYGAYSGGKSLLEGNTPAKVGLDTLLGAGQGATSTLFGAGGQATASGLSNLAAKATGKIISPVAVKTAGTAIGGAVGGAVTNPQDPLTGALVQGGLGALTPSKVVNQDAYDAQITKNADAYRDLIPVSAVNIRNLVKGGITAEDLNNSYNVMAKEGVPVLEDHGTKDTQPAITSLKQSEKSFIDDKQQMLATNPSPQFNLDDFKSQAIQKINGMSRLDPLTKASAIADVGAHIQAAQSDPSIGNNVTGQTADLYKSQMYGVGFDQFKPTNEIAAKAIASVIKNNIEKAYPNQPIEAINDKIGQYQAAKDLLTAAHGTKVTGTKGSTVAQIAGGAITGATAYAAGANPVLSLLLSPVGGAVSSKVNDLIQAAHNDPSNITKNLKGRLSSLTVK